MFDHLYKMDCEIAENNAQNAAASTGVARCELSSGDFEAYRLPLPRATAIYSDRVGGIDRFLRINQKTRAMA